MCVCVCIRSLYTFSFSSLHSQMSVKPSRRVYFLQSIPSQLEDGETRERRGRVSSLLLSPLSSLPISEVFSLSSSSPTSGRRKGERAGNRGSVRPSFSCPCSLSSSSSLSLSTAIHPHFPHSRSPLSLSLSLHTHDPTFLSSSSSLSCLCVCVCVSLSPHTHIYYI